MSGAFEQLIAELSAEIGKRRKTASMAKALDPSMDLVTLLAPAPPPRRQVIVVRKPTFQELSPSEQRRRLIKAEPEIFAKALDDLKAGHITAADVARLEAAMNRAKTTSVAGSR